MRRSLRAGIVGAGLIGRIHAQAARAAGAEVVAVVASSPERSRAAAEALGVKAEHRTWEEVVADPRVDVVHVCTPNVLHAPVTAEALRAGKHVVCEKPLALDLDEAGSLEPLLEPDCVVAVPFVYRYHPVVREARARVAAGTLGQLRLIHGSYLQDWLASPDQTNWRVDPEAGGASRAFADIGSHWCDLVEFVSGHRITHLTAQIAIAVPSRPGAGRVVTEDIATMLFRTDRGAAGSAVISQVEPGRRNRLWFEIGGEHASVAFDQEQPETLWVGERDGVRLVPRDPTLLAPDAARLATLPGGHPQGYRDCFDAFVADAYDAISGRPPEGLPGFEDGLRGLRLTDALLRSSRDSTWIEV